MNRRAALAALLALPATTQISVARLKPRDVIVVECDERLSHATVEQMRTSLTQIWPDHKVVVFTQGMHVKVLSETDA